jgi:hypothetical protein
MVVSQSAFFVPELRLALQRLTNESIQLSWPMAYSGWELEASPNLGTGTWTSVLAPGTMPDVSPTGDWVVTAPAGGWQGYFRLIKRP